MGAEGGRGREPWGEQQCPQGTRVPAWSQGQDVNTSVRAVSQAGAGTDPARSQDPGNPTCSERSQERAPASQGDLGGGVGQPVLVWSLSEEKKLQRIPIVGSTWRFG